VTAAPRAVRRRAALALLCALALPPAVPASAQPVPAGRAEVAAETVSLMHAGGFLGGHLAHPDVADGRLGSILLLRGSPGLDDRTRAFAGFLALNGYVVFAPDLAAGMDPTAVDDALDVAARFVRGHALANGRLALLAVGRGGEAAVRFAATADDLSALVLAGAPPPPPEAAAAIRAPTVMHLAAGAGGGEPEGLAAARAAMAAVGTSLDVHLYDAEAAAVPAETGAGALAWRRTRDHLRPALSPR
jgi:carboxymethylenebutenolidase